MEQLLSRRVRSSPFSFQADSDTTQCNSGVKTQPDKIVFVELLLASSEMIVSWVDR